MEKKSQIGSRKGFTLIEILIVVAIIGILASVVLVGLRPAQRLGRDARRLSDLRQIQVVLELYFNKCGFYPGGFDCTDTIVQPNWTGLRDALTNAGLGVTKLPSDPLNNSTYYYRYGASPSSRPTNYVLGAQLEDANNPALRDDVDSLSAGGNIFGVDCGFGNPETPSPIYCLQL